MERAELLFNRSGLREFCERNNKIKELAEKTKQKPLHLFLGLSVILILFLVMTSFGNILVTVVLNFLYPLYMSYKDLQAKGELRRKWLIYWMCLGFVFGFGGIFAIFLKYFPFSKILLSFLLTTLYLPGFEKYNQVYEKFFKPLLKKYEENIDKYLQMVLTELKSKVDDTKKSN